MRAIRKLIYIIKAGFKGAWQHRGMGIASIGSITAVLIILGFFLISALGINNVLGDTQYKVDDIEIFMQIHCPENYIANLQQILQQDRRVKEVYFKSSKEAMEAMRQDLGDKASLLDNLGEDILPASFNVKLKNIDEAHTFVSEYSKKQGVDTIGYYKDLVDKIARLAGYGKIAALVVLLGLILLAFFVISNTIKLTVIARRKEIGVMRHVGAKNGFITGPFILEGIIFGIIGAALALAIVYFGYRHVFQQGNDLMYQFFYSNLVKPDAILLDLVIIFASLGIGIGIVGSVFSMKRYLQA